MADWQAWHTMASASQQAAQSLEALDPRSCVSRYYYGAYQGVTAVLLYQGATPPAGREAWNHEATPELLVEKWESLLKRDACQDLAQRLKRLYKIRVNADYVGNDETGTNEVREAGKTCNFILKTVNALLVGGSRT